LYLHATLHKNCKKKHQTRLHLTNHIKTLNSAQIRLHMLCDYLPDAWYGILEFNVPLDTV